MHAVQFDAYGGSDVLALRKIPPPQPADGDVVVDVHAASLNPVDWKLRSGLLAGAIPLTFPATTGRDGAGIVSAIGGGVDPQLCGRRVAFFAPRGHGTWSEQIALPASNVAPVPDAVSLAEAAALPLAGTSAWIPLIDIAKVSSGMRVLVHAGAGGVGSLAIQIARARGAEVFATCSQRNAEFVTSLGAGAVAYDLAPFETQIRDIDVVLDTLGGDVHRRSYAVLKPGGLMVCLSAEPFEDRGAVHGVTVKTAPILPKREILEDLLAMAATGKLRVIIERTLPLTEFRQAHELSQSGHVRGKIVMSIRNSDGTPVA